ncbi:MAG: hypothetical protein ALAOOOJD_03789 [bacterium]|nr:hypothetical protein [bacterium]
MRRHRNIVERSAGKNLRNRLIHQRVFVADGALFILAVIRRAFFCAENKQLVIRFINHHCRARPAATLLHCKILPNAVLASFQKADSSSRAGVWVRFANKKDFVIRTNCHRHVVVALGVSKLRHHAGLIRPTAVGIAIFVAQKSEFAAGRGVIGISHANVVLAVARKCHGIQQTGADQTALEGDYRRPRQTAVVRTHAFKF